MPLLCNSTNNTEESTRVVLADSKTTTIKKEERVALETIRLSNSNSSNKVDHPNSVVRASRSGSKDSSNSKLEESILPPQPAADGRTKPLAVVGAAVLLNPVAGKEVEFPPCT